MIEYLFATTLAVGSVVLATISLGELTGQHNDEREYNISISAKDLDGRRGTLDPKHKYSKTGPSTVIIYISGTKISNEGAIEGVTKVELQDDGTYEGNTEDKVLGEKYAKKCTLRHLWSNLGNDKDKSYEYSETPRGQTKIKTPMDNARAFLDGKDVFSQDTGRHLEDHKPLLDIIDAGPKSQNNQTNSSTDTTGNDPFVRVEKTMDDILARDDPDKDNYANQVLAVKKQIEEEGRPDMSTRIKDAHIRANEN